MDHFVDRSCLAGMVPNEFSHLDKHTRDRLRKFMSQCCEKAFRRGFQQGHDSATRGDEVVNLDDWRFFAKACDSPSPHGTYHSTAVARFDLECHPDAVGLGRDRSGRTVPDAR